MARAGTSPRARANDRVKAAAFLGDPSVKIEEKIDGTKLTLIRRNNEFDPSNYAKNWIIAYKGNVIFPGEAKGLSSREKEVREKSSGVAQYSLVHDHMAKVHPNTASIPQGTEFFLEFVQRKPTISRDYPQKHGLFLTLFGPTRYKITGSQLVSNITPTDDDETLAEYAQILGVRTYPVLFEGNLGTIESLLRGTKSSVIRRKIESSMGSLQASYDDATPDRPIKIIESLYDIFSDFDTTLSTETETSSAEGSVFKPSMTKTLYKALRFDQHDAGHRSDVKSKFRAEDPQQEQAYWDSVVTIANEIVQELGLNSRKNVPESDLDNILDVIRNKCYFDSSISNRLGNVVHPKSLIQRQEDLFLTTKSRVMKRLEVGEKTGFALGIFVVSGKPIHDGHWKVIDIATKECDEVLVITSTAGRDELPAGVMIDAWRVVLEPQFHRDYPNATLLITSESPVSLAIDKMRELKNIVSSFIFYADDEDIRGKYSPDRMSAAIKDPVAIEKLRPRAVPRIETTQISGTRMREFLKNDDRNSFDNFVPHSLSPEMKEKYWKILKNEYGNVQDSRIRPISKVLYEALKRQAPKDK
jgi:hypothetical protein